jgi:hypothetical protein
LAASKMNGIFERKLSAKFQVLSLLPFAPRRELPAVALLSQSLLQTISLFVVILTKL